MKADAKTRAVLPSAVRQERMGFARATAGLAEDQAIYLQMVLAYYRERGGQGLRGSMRTADLVFRRVFGAGPKLSYGQVARRFERLDQGMLRAMRACERN